MHILPVQNHFLGTFFFIYFPKLQFKISADWITDSGPNILDEKVWGSLKAKHYIFLLLVFQSSGWLSFVKM